MIILFIALMLANLWAFYELYQSSENVVTKVLWAVVIIILPVVGLILWYLLGPKGENSPLNT